MALPPALLQQVFAARDANNRPVLDLRDRARAASVSKHWRWSLEPRNAVVPLPELVFQEDSLAYHNMGAPSTAYNSWVAAKMAGSAVQGLILLGGASSKEDPPHPSLAWSWRLEDILKRLHCQAVRELTLTLDAGGQQQPTTGIECPHIRAAALLAQLPGLTSLTYSASWSASGLPEGATVPQLRALHQLTVIGWPASGGSFGPRCVNVDWLVGSRAGPLPQLTRVCLSSCSQNIDPSRLPALKHLELDNVPPPPRPPGLAGASQLRSLTVRHVGTSAWYRLQPADLPCTLSRMELGDSAVGALAHLLPSLTQVRALRMEAAYAPHPLPPRLTELWCGSLLPLAGGSGEQLANLQVLCLERRGAGYVSVEEICCLQAQLPSLRQLAFGWGSEIPEMQERVLAALCRLLPGVDVKVGRPLAQRWGT